MIVGAVHASGRFDRRGPVLTRAGKQYRKYAPIVTHTEASGARGDLDAPGDGWSWGQAHDGPAADECAAQWHNHAWTVVEQPRSHVLTNITWVRSQEYGGSRSAPTRALVVGLTPNAKADRDDLPLLWLIVAHMPLENTELRRTAWLDACDGLTRLCHDLRAQEPKSKILVNADWNRSFRDPHERELLAREVARPCHLWSCWAGRIPKTGGTHGPMGIIDGTYTDLIPTGCALLPDDGSSDHRAYKARARA